ncbi:MAG: helix-turn-helix transcriptional regulator [Solirubrobacterales bacterium]|nr:helix-turn-helix transcriptional regulator [Solirubrobacterales bacterium]
MPKTSERRKPRNAADAVAHVLAHRIRVDILTVLHEAPASQKQLAEELREPLSNISHHVNELKEAGAIEVAFTRAVGNVEQHFYSAAKFSAEPEDLARLSRVDHQALSRIIVQSITAELLASLRAEMLSGDPYAATAWDRLCLDCRGYRNMNENVRQFFDRSYEIAAESGERMVKTGEAGKTYIAAAMSFERSRREANTTANVGHLAAPPLGGELPFEKSV